LHERANILNWWPDPSGFGITQYVHQIQLCYNAHSQINDNYAVRRVHNKLNQVVSNVHILALESHLIKFFEKVL
jgi:hypothetical protein